MKGNTLITSKEDLYSRATGILEHSVLEDKHVTVVGLGSFGSVIPTDLARAGVGHFTLIDFDRLEPSNVARHQCGLSDLGRLKTDAVKDQILDRNPYARIRTEEININEKPEILKEAMQNSDLTLCMTDENESRSRINSMGIELGKTVIFGRAITRAEGGDIFILRGHDKDLPCLECLIGAGLFNYQENEKTQFAQERKETPAYVSDEDVEATIQVGLFSDISPITNMITKLSLVELAKGKESGLESLEEDLTSQYYFWVNRRESKYASWEPMGLKPNRLSILRWYGVKIQKSTNCISCLQFALT